MHRQICVKDFSGTTAHRISKFGTKIGYDNLYRVRVNQHPLCLFFPLFFHLSRSPIKYFVKDISRATSAWILKFRINIEYDLYCVRENQHPHAYHILYFPFFFFVNTVYILVRSGDNRLSAYFYL